VGSNVVESDWEISDTTLMHGLARTAHQHPDRIFVRCEAGDITYQAFYGVVAQLGERLRAQVMGQDVGLFLPNGLAFLAGYYALLHAQARPALININTPLAGVQKLVTDLAPALAITNQQVEGVDVLNLSDADVLAMAQTAVPGPAREDVAVRGDDVCAVMFTGGTTGLPKRLNHSHTAMTAAMDRIEWGWPTRDGDVWLPVAPFTHIYGYLMGVTNPLLRGGTLVIPPQFQPALVVDMLTEHRVTVFGGGPPAIYQAVLAAPNFQSADLSHLRVCPGGGAPFPMALHQQWQAATGLTIAEGYGMTEMAPISINTAHAGLRFGSAGMPCPGNGVAIADLETGEQRLTAGEKGEILINGPHMMKHYEGNAEETAATLRHGFVYTGDIGMLDEDGFLIITDRKKDVIFHKGFNVFPREVEEALLTVPGAQQACVVGLADERAGEAVVAFVMANEAVDEAAFKAHAEAHLAAYKVPAHIVVEAALPLTANGKLDRLALRAQAQQTFGA